MLNHALTPQGQCNVTAVIQSEAENGPDAIINAAMTWSDYLLDKSELFIVIVNGHVDLNKF